MFNTQKIVNDIIGRNKKKYNIYKDDITSLWYAQPAGVNLGFSWREKVTWLGYPRKDAYQKAKELGLI